MKKAVHLLLFVLIAGGSQAQLVVNAGVTPAQLVAGFMGSGLAVSNINLNCAAAAYGTFSNGNSTNLGVTNGGVFTTGSAAGTIGPNNSASYSFTNGTFTSDPNLTTIEPQATNDPCILTFDVIPSCTTLTIRFVFGSEEYPEWVSAGYNDAFGFFITGPNPSGPAYSGYNVARLPNSTPVSIDNVNAGMNAAFYVNNAGGATIQYDGITTVITSNLAVVPCSTYVFKIAIADAGDYVYDSGVFIDLLTCSSAIVTTTSSVPTCGCSGSATVNASGGQPPYTYAWTPGGQTTPTATGLCPGNYTISVVDQSGCIANSNSTVVNVGSLGAGTPSIQSSTNVNCNGGNNGNATATISGGTSPFTYVWSNGQTSQTATGLIAGTYTVTITDGNGCAASTAVTISEPALLSVTSSGTLAGCSLNNGTATANPSGGTPSYTYAWSPGGQNSQTATGLSGGTYTCVITDANGCSATTTVNVNSTPAPATTASSTQATCAVANGTGTANPSGGTPGYTYSWSPGGQTSQTATGLSSGNYMVTVTDANGCTATATVSVTSANGPTLTASTLTNISCNGGNNGSATATPTGGTPGYTYSWSNGQTNQTATGLSAGTYTVTVTDANNCSFVATTNVSQPAILAASFTQTNVTCNGGTNGSATVNASGGTLNYTYSWTPSGGNAATASNLGSGIYFCTVTDANGCTTVVPVTISQPAAIVLAPSQTNVLCNGNNNGIATVTPSGGTPGYTYSWSPSGGNAQTATNLVAGNYTVTVTDASGCTKQSVFTITQPPPVSLSVSGDDSLCSGESTQLSAAATGGTPAYTYVWMPGPQSGTSLTITPTSSVSYSVSMTDASGCVSTTQIFNVFVFPAPNALFDTASTGMYSSVYAFNDLSTGGSSWSWNFGDNSTGSTLQNPVHTFPGAGTYTVTQIVFNQFGCPDTFKIIVDVGEGILVPNVFTPDGNGQNDVWYVPNSGMKEFHVVIFDRWGLKVWETTADEIRWDGRSTSGKLLADGTYYFALDAILRTSSNGTKLIQYTGYISLLTKNR